MKAASLFTIPVTWLPTCLKLIFFISTDGNPIIYDETSAGSSLECLKLEVTSPPAGVFINEKASKDRQVYST